MATKATGNATAAAAKAKAAQKEVTGEGPETVEVTFEVQGAEVTVTAPASIQDAPFEVPMLIEEEKPISAFALLAGKTGVETMREAGATVRDFTAFITAYQEKTGLGNS